MTINRSMKWALTTFVGAILVALGTTVAGWLTGWLNAQQPPPTKEEIEIVELCRRSASCRQQKQARALFEQGYSAKEVAIKLRAAGPK